jgi:hypothetical protein
MIVARHRPKDPVATRSSAVDQAFASTYPSYYQAITNSLPFRQTPTPLFSSKSTLFRKNTRGGGYPCF